MTAPSVDRWLEVRGARIHNLRGVDLRLPHGLLVTFTGRSGSGKSSLAVDTIMAEAHRRAVQSMTAYARQFAAQFSKPPVDSISGLCSTIFIDQGQVNRNPRSTLGTSTDIFDLLRVLFARFGRPACPSCGKPMTEPDGRRWRCAAHPGQRADRLDPKDFSFNLPFGACQSCGGLGSALQPDAALVVPEPARSVRDGAIRAFQADRFAEVHLAVAVALCEQRGIDPDAPWSKLPPAAHRLLLATEPVPVQMRPPGGAPWQTSYQGAFGWLRQRYLAADSDAARARIGAFMQQSGCPDCAGSRLAAGPRGYRLAGHSLAGLCAMSLEDCLAATAELAAVEGAAEVVAEIAERLAMLVDLGLGYLSLDRSAPSLSGGEGQRARLASQLGTGLFGLMYVLDEPSAGLHPQDTERLVRALRALRDQGNTVLVVEHDRQVIQAGDWIVDVGPGAGRDGGTVLYSGPTAGIGASPESVTGPYLADPAAARIAPAGREPGGELRITGAMAHNLAGLDVRIPLRQRVAITGVSGAGKSSLVHEIVLPGLRSLGIAVPRAPAASGQWRAVELAGELDRVIIVDQAPIGRTPRSNPATYCGVFDGIRKVFAGLPAAKAAKLSAKHFSFNLPEGRCPTCAGDGELRMQMQFLPDAVIGCEDCQGRRYQQRVLDVQREGRSIADVLDLSVDEARTEFARVPGIRRVLDTMSEIGLGYLRLGQPAPSLSGGEAQRLKLATELHQAAAGPTLYVLDEPTTGLHPADVARLAATLDRLVDGGHSVLVVEHDPDLIASSDWVIDLGPGGGRHGGRLVVAGPPAMIRDCPQSATGRFL